MQVYSNHKFFAYPDRLAAIRERRVAAPVHVRIKPINHCNHNCWYCAYRADQLQLGEGMDLKDRIPEAKMFELIGDVIDIGVEAVTFSGGGEPLLYKALPECVERLAGAGVKVAALTNGSNLKGRVADAFAEHGTWVRVSLDAWDDASYAKSRGIKQGAFSQVIDNIRAFAARGSDCVLGVSFIVSAENVDRITDVCKMLGDAGADHVKLSAAIVSNDVHENNLYHRAIIDRAAAAIKEAKALTRDGFSVLDHYHETDERFDKGYDFCPYLNFLTVVGADCNVYACQDKAYTDGGRLGSIKERSFKEFWFSDENRARIWGIAPSRNCRHHCISHAKNAAIVDFLSLHPDHARFV